MENVFSTEFIDDMDDYYEYVQKQIDDGYIDGKGTPLKCSCGSTDLEEFDTIYDEIGKVEYSVKCKSCGKNLSHWAYGQWEM